MCQGATLAHQALSPSLDQEPSYFTVSTSQRV
jgi:hypothetical protein